MKRDTFDTVYETHVSRIYRYALARTGSVEDAQDITSQTFLAAFQQWSRFQGQAQVSTWLFGIAHHKLADHFRSRTEAALLNDADDGTSIEAQLEEMLKVERVLQAMEALSDDRREAIGLHIFGALSLSETAAVMERSYGAVQMLIQRGLEDLRQRLKEYV